MKSKILINKIIPQFNYKKIDETYDIFCLTTSKNYIERGAMIIDTPLFEKSIKAVMFDDSRKLYLLIEHKENNRTKVKNILSEPKYGRTMSFEKLHSFQLSERHLLQLLLNGLVSRNHPLLRFNNLTGHLYVFKPNWLDKNKKENSIWGIKTLEIQVSDSLVIKLAVRTFTSTKLKNEITFGKKKLKDYPKYILSTETNSIRRKTAEDNQLNENTFIMRQVDNEKNSITFLNISNNDAFEASKIGVLTEIVDEFNSRYSGLASISFESVNEYETIVTTKTKEENIKSVKSFLENKSIKIVDCICEEDTKVYCNEIANLIKKEYGVKAKIGVRLSKKALNIRLIHNQEFYESNNLDNDPHQDNLNGYSVQHITFEDFMAGGKYAISAVIHELIIKDDINKGKISLYDWSSLGFYKTISFGYSTGGKSPRYFFMNITPQGLFDFSEQQNDLFTFNEYSSCMQIFDDDEKVVGAIKYTDDDILVIKNTDLFTLPEMYELHNELLNNNTALRNIEARNQYLTSVTEIRSFKKDGRTFYFVGVTGRGMKTTFQNSILIREVSQVKSGNSDFIRLLPLMNVSFVRNGQLTVVPFPFKYLKEYIRNIMQNE